MLKGFRVWGLGHQKDVKRASKGTSSGLQSRFKGALEGFARAPKDVKRALEGF